MKEVLKAKLDTLPSEPGVYVFRDSSGHVIYVGKAKSLPDRVRSYFTTPAEGDYKGEALREEIADLEVTVCSTEVDALVLEATLIKRYKPRFNINLRDDKSYPYIAVTISDEFPRIGLVREKRVKGVRYYGPYVSVRAARSTLRLLRKVFPLRHCPGNTPGRGRGRPCLYYDMKMCLGPCTGDVEPEEYGGYVKSFCDFLEGRYEAVLKELDSRMREASRAQEYEQAARYRNQIEAADRVLEHHRSLSSSHQDYDVIGLARDETQACFIVAQNRAGVHLGNLCFMSDLASDEPGAELIVEFLKRYYDQSGSIPQQIIVTSLPPEERALDEWLSEQRGSLVEVRVPSRGKKRTELKLASSNAELALEGAKTARAGDQERVERALNELAGYLGLERYPLRIECYDISTFAGSASVGSMVVFQDGMPDRRYFRKFAMKFTPGVDDVGMMKEVLYRRFKRFQRESGPEGSPAGVGWARRPDLVLVDGGKAQLGAALEVLKVLGITGLDAAALAKRLEEVYRPGRPDPVVMPRNSEALFLLQRIRDEAHRVAVSYNRSIMEKGTGRSWLDNVAGVGPTRKKALIRHFGSPGKIAGATLEEIEAVEGVTKPVAEAVHEAAARMKGTG